MTAHPDACGTILRLRHGLALVIERGREAHAQPELQGKRLPQLGAAQQQQPPPVNAAVQAAERADFERTTSSGVPACPGPVAISGPDQAPPAAQPHTEQQTTEPVAGQTAGTAGPKAPIAQPPQQQVGYSYALNASTWLCLWTCVI